MKRRVLQLIGSLSEGGSERQAIQLAWLLNRSGRYNVDIACLDAGGVLRDEVETLGFKNIREFPLTSFYDANALKQLWRFARFLREREIDLVHTHDFYTNVFGMPAAALAGTSTRIASRRETTGWRTGIQRFVELRAYGLAHTVLANADAVCDQLLREGVPREKTVTIYNSVGLERVSAPSVTRQDEALAALNLCGAGDSPLVTIVANLRHKVKNHSMFLRAARGVSQAVPQARFVIAGEGELMTPLRAMADQLGLSDKVLFIGRCARIAELLALSKVCVLSSTAEGFSNSILEYMAASRPVVATDVGGAREAVVDGLTGYLVRMDDDKAMADRIIYLLRNSEVATAMGRSGRQVVEEKFSCEAQLEKIETLYDRLLTRMSPQVQLAPKRDSKISLESER